MQDEIKEILFLLHNDRLTDSGKRKLEDYITNLQKYYNDNVNKYEELLVKYSDLQDTLKDRERYCREMADTIDKYDEIIKDLNKRINTYKCITKKAEEEIDFYKFIIKGLINRK